MALLTGREVRRILEYYSPFNADGSLRPDSERATVLAANANTPIEVFARAFCMVAARGSGSPVLIQLSHNCINLVGSDPKSLKVPTGVLDPGLNPAVEGAIISAFLIDSYAQEFGTPYVGITLDHFTLPRYDPNNLPGADLNSLDARLAEARIHHAAQFMAPVFGDEAKYDEKTLVSYVNYLLSPNYRKFKQDFLAVIDNISPAWGMIDTEKLPPLLDFVVTREITEGVRSELNNQDVLIEAEFGATGQFGEALDYQPVRGKELEGFAQRVAAFVKYTAADAVAYPIGMEHAAKRGVAHEPDVERLKVVGATLVRNAARYVPFVQHGGTGASEVARGLVGKNNINTFFLVAAANAIADHVQANLQGIREGEKGACGTKIYTAGIQAVAEAAVTKLKESGTYDVGATLGGVLDG